MSDTFGQLGQGETTLPVGNEVPQKDTASLGEIQPEPLVVAEEADYGIINTFSKPPTEDHSKNIHDPKNIIHKSMLIKKSQYLKDITNS